MYLSGIIGVFFVLYGPLVFCGAASVVSRPQLLVVALFGAAASLLSFLITGVFYNLLRSIFPSSTSSLTLATVVVVLHVVAAGALRVSLFILLLRVEGFARTFGQVLIVSPIRLALVAAAAGCGFGALSAMRGAGTMIDATRRLTFYTEGTTAYDMHICPQLPLLLHSTLQATLLLFAQIAWAVMTGQAMAKLQGLSLKDARRVCVMSCCCWCKRPPFVEDVTLESSDAVLCVPLRPSFSGVDDGMVTMKSTECTGVGFMDSGPHTATSTRSPKKEVEVTHSEINPSLGEREEKETEGREFTRTTVEEAGETTRETIPETEREKAVTVSDPLYEEGGLITQLSLHQQKLLQSSWTMALRSLTASFLLHLLFALASLLNRGAYNYETHEEVPWRGCAVSLPIEASITTVSLIWSGFLVYYERHEEKA